MRARLIVATLVVIGLFASVVRGGGQSAIANGSIVVGNGQCLQDAPVATPPNPDATVVMCGLDNPRGLAFGQHALYVAEAGRGGLGAPTRQCFTGNAVGALRCYGANGAVTRLWNGVQEQIVTGLPSHANMQGRQAIGPHDIAVIGGADVIYVTIGFQQPPGFRDEPAWPFLSDFAKLVRVAAAGVPETVADLGTYEALNDPDQAFYEPDKLDTNPYGLLAEPGGGLIVTDAGANSMVRVSASGDMSTVAVFAPDPDDAVPTSVSVGPDGAYYVSELTGFPAVAGAANIYRVGRAGEAPEACVTGFTQVIDIAFDRQGDLYVLEYATVFATPPTGGTVIRVSPNRHAAADRGDHSVLCAQYAAGDRTPIVAGLTQPSSIAVGADGGIYVSNRGISPGIGQVIRFERPAK